jgi:hypothetical protein
MKSRTVPDFWRLFRNLPPDIQRKAYKAIAYGEQILSQVVCVLSALAKLSQSIQCESDEGIALWVFLKVTPSTGISSATMTNMSAS